MMEKEQLKQRLVKLKKDLATKRRKLQKCERLFNARHHVQQKIREQSELMQNEESQSGNCSDHVHTKVTFETCAEEEADLTSSPEHCDASGSSALRMAISAGKSLHLPNNNSEDQHGSCEQSKCQNVVKYQSSLAAEEDDSHLNLTYVIKSRTLLGSNCDMEQPLPSNDSDSSEHSELSSKVNRRDMNPQVCTIEKQESVLCLRQQHQDGADNEDCSTLDECVQSHYGRHCSRESLDLQHSSGHAHKGSLQELFDCNEMKLHTIASSPTVPDQTSKKQTDHCTDQFTSEYENKTKLRHMCNSSEWILDNDSQLSENIQNIGFIADTPCQLEDSGQFQSNKHSEMGHGDSVLPNLDTKEKVVLHVGEDKENIGVRMECLTRLSEDSNQDDTSPQKQNCSIQFHKRRSEASLLDLSSCEWEDDMYSQVKSRTNRRERHSSLHSEPLAGSQCKTRPSFMSQNNHSASSSEANILPKNGKFNKSKTFHKQKKTVDHNYAEIWTRTPDESSVMKDVFSRLQSDVQSCVSDFVLPESDFGKLLAAKINCSLPITCDGLETEASVSTLPDLQQNKDVGSPIAELKCSVAVDVGSEESCVNLAEAESKMLGYESSETDTNSSSIKQSQDNRIFEDNKADEVFCYHSSIKLQHDEPIQNLSCDVNEKLKPQKVIAGCTPFRILIWLCKGTGWRVANMWTLEQLEAECILSCFISTCHKWIFIWTTVQCSTRLTAVSLESTNKVLKILWTTNILFTNSARHYSLMLNTAELIIGSVTQSNNSQLIKVVLSESNGTAVVDDDTKSIKLDMAQEELTSLIRVERLPEALLGTASSLLYIWNHVSGRLVHRVDIQRELVHCPLAYHHQGILLIVALTKNDQMGHLLAVDPTSGKTSLLYTLEMTSKDKNTRLTNLQGNDKLLCGQDDDNSVKVWCANNGRLLAHSHKRLQVNMIYLCQSRMLVIVKNEIHVYNIC